MAVLDLLSKGAGKKLFLLGNEAIVRGALEAGIDMATTYPGTPASEIGDTFSKIAKDVGMYFEYSVNEMVALEMASAASACGLRTLTSMKHVGLNVASDTLMTIAYTGVVGGEVIVVADEPSCHSSQNEQDNRYYAKLANIPMLEPCNVNEAKEMCRTAFDISEKLELPIILRTTTRVNHMRGVVTLGEVIKGKGKKEFHKNPYRYVVVPHVARASHILLLERMKKASDISENYKFNEAIKGEGKIGIITSGVSYNYVKEGAEKLGIKPPILKLGMTHPLPAKLCASFISKLDSVLVVEELEPILESQIKMLAKDVNPKLQIFGKETSHFSRLYEYTNDIVLNAMSSIFKGGKMMAEVKSGKTEHMAASIEHTTVNKADIEAAKKLAPSRPPVLCAGCPHRSTYYAVKMASKDKAICTTDIGCYTLGFQPPLNMGDYLLCMGASIGAACGFSKATDQPIVAFIGDSTFFHAGIPGLINAVHNKHRFVLVILDNLTTAMTGHQTSPGNPIDGMGNPAPRISIEKIVESCDVKFVRTIDPSSVKEAISVFKDAFAQKELAVIIARAPCILLKEYKKERMPYYVDQELCKKCNHCLDKFACPAFYVEGETININRTLCTGCNVCAQICPAKAIKPIK
ncbi:MAG: indolepyruvate ferredoxin oxidoreductase subunit alpha [Thermoplasmata archaeon]